MKKLSSLSILLLTICMAVCLPAIAGDDELAGAWRTPEEETVIITLLLYPEDAFRLYQYDQDAGVTHMLEGVCIVEDGIITVSEVRLGILDAAGEYTQTDEMETVSYLYTIVPSDPPMLALMFDEMETYFLYPYDPDGPGDWQRQDPEDIGISLVSDSANYIKAGQSAYIALSENLTTPVFWECTVTDDSVMALVSDQYIMDDNPHDFDGVGGTHWYYFKAIAPGECTIRLLERDRSGEPAQNLEIMYDIVVGEANSDVRKVKVGQVFSISMDENQSIPYRWNPEISDGTLIELSHDEIDSSGVTSDMPGAGGQMRVFYFTALRPGECTISMNYMYMFPEDGDEIVQTESHTIMIEQ